MSNLAIRSRAPKWIAGAIVVAGSVLGILGLAAPGAPNQAGAASPTLAQIEAQSTNNPIRRESAPPSNGPAPRTGPASPYQPLDIPSFGTNYRANTDTQTPNLAQQEPSIAVNPTNPLDIVAAAKDERAGSNTKQVWIYTSTDGGVSWINQEFPLAAPASSFSSDPVVNFSDDGQCYVTALPYGGGSSMDGIQIARSTDGGITFTTGVHLPGSNNNSDKEWTWVDNFPSSPFYHRIYNAWMNFGAGSLIALNYSSDRGITWSPLVSVGSANQFPMPVVLPNGNVLVSDFSGNSVVYRRSTDGGQTFGGTTTVSSVSAPQCPPDDAGCGIWRMNPIPANSVNPTNGTMIVVWADGRTSTNRALTYYSRSTDNGATWSAAAQLAPPGASNVYQVEPWVTYDEQGIAHAIWYDDRDNPNTSTFNIYYSESTDDGVTWSTAARISTATSDLRIGIPSSYAGAAGDYINVTASQGNVYAVWTDTRSGTGEDVYMVRGIYGSGGTPTATVTGTPPTATRTNTPSNTPTPTATVCGNYSYATGTATIVPGVGDTGNHCDDCTTSMALPFPYTLYNQTFTTANIDSDGRLEFTSNFSNPSNSCLPSTGDDYTVFPYWTDVCTGPCASSTCTGCGVFTSTTGTAPNRILNIEWRSDYYDTNSSANFEVRLYEGQSKFDVIYGTIAQGNSPATSGVQGPGGLFVQYFCDGSGGPATGSVTYTGSSCGSPGPTSTTGPSTNTPTNTPTQSGGATATSTSPAASPTTQPTQTPGGPSATTAPSSTPPPPDPTPFSTATPGTPFPDPTACTLSFTDVPPNSTYYQWIRCLACLGIINGYPDGTFRPNRDVTRGQLAKIASNSAGFSDTPTGQQFQDVPPTGPDSTFYAYIYRLVIRGYINGYPCGGPSEPCIPPNNLPYFRPNTPVTRGQITKIISNAADFNDPPSGQQFQDVPVGSTFYTYTYRLVTRGVMSGYPCGAPPAGPCIPPDNLPYFRPNNNATRGQTSKVDANSFFPDCDSRDK